MPQKSSTGKVTQNQASMGKMIPKIRLAGAKWHKNQAVSTVKVP